MSRWDPAIPPFRFIFGPQPAGSAVFALAVFALQVGGADVPSPLPHNLRKAIAVYEAGKALTAYITPDYEEIAR